MLCLMAFCNGYLQVTPPFLPVFTLCEVSLTALVPLSEVFACLTNLSCSCHDEGHCPSPASLMCSFVHKGTFLPLFKPLLRLLHLPFTFRNAIYDYLLKRKMRGLMHLLITIIGTKQMWKMSVNQTQIVSHFLMWIYCLLCSCPIT